MLPALLFNNLAFAAGLLVAVALCAALVLFAYRVCSGNQQESAGPAEAPPVRRQCRYCHWGVARLVEEKVRYELGDMVEVRCFACERCGLPHWVINRTHVPRRAMR